MSKLKRFTLAYELSKQVVDERNIKDAKLYEPIADPFGNQCYKIDLGNNLILAAEIGTVYGNIEIRFSLTMVANDILLLIDHLLSDEKAAMVLRPSVIYELRKRNISMLQLFDTNPDEIEEATRETAKRGLDMFIPNIPLFARSAIVDALGHTKIGYCQHFLKPILKDHWKSFRFAG